MEIQCKNIYFGEGSDWNPETDGVPGCICQIDGEHHHGVEWLMARDDYYKQLDAMELKAPDTGEPPVVGICGSVTLILVAIIAISRRFTWAYQREQNSRQGSIMSEKKRKML